MQKAEGTPRGISRRTFIGAAGFAVFFGPACATQPSTTTGSANERSATTAAAGGQTEAKPTAAISAEPPRSLTPQAPAKKEPARDIPGVIVQQEVDRRNNIVDVDEAIMWTETERQIRNITSPQQRLDLVISTMKQSTIFTKTVNSMRLNGIDGPIAVPHEKSAIGVNIKLENYKVKAGIVLTDKYLQGVSSPVVAALEIAGREAYLQQILPQVTALAQTESFKALPQTTQQDAIDGLLLRNKRRAEGYALGMQAEKYIVYRGTTRPTPSLSPAERFFETHAARYIQLGQNPLSEQWLNYVLQLPTTYPPGVI